jgi:hypothetical protein
MINLDNDTQVLSATLQEKSGSAIRLLLPGDHTPDGEPIVQLVQQVNADVASKWCNYVRGEVNARKNRKEAEASSRTDNDTRRGGGSATAAQRSRGDSSATDAGVPGSEEELEAYLRASQVSLGGRRQEILSSMDALEGELLTIERALRRVTSALEAFKKED